MYLTSKDINDFYYEIEILLGKIYEVYYAIDYKSGITNHPENVDKRFTVTLEDDFIPKRVMHYEQDAIIIRQESLPKYFEKIETLLIATGNNSVGLAKAQRLYDSAVEKHIYYIGRCDYYKTYIAERDPNKSFDLAINYTIENLDAFLKHFDDELSQYKTANLDHSKEYLTVINNVLEIKKEISVNNQNLGIERINEDLDDKPDDNKLSNKPKKKELVYTFKEAISKVSDYNKVKLLIKDFKLKTNDDFLSACTMQRALYLVLVPLLKPQYKASGKFKKLLTNEFKFKKECSDRALRNTYTDPDDWESQFKNYLDQR